MLIEEDWKKIPFGIRRHFQESIRDYKKTYGYPLPLTSLENIKKWNSLRIEVPAGRWWVHLGDFKLCGEGQYPRTVVPPNSASEGIQLPSRPNEKLGHIVEDWLDGSL